MKNLLFGILLTLAFALTACQPRVHTEHLKAATATEQGAFHLVALDAQGGEIWTEEIPNALADQGEQMFLDVVLRGATAPAQYYLRLYNATPTETSTLSGLTNEASGGGYAPQLIERSAVGWPTLALDAGDYQAVSKQVVFTASGGTIGPVTHAVLATTSDNTGLLVSYAALSQTRTLADGESLTITYRIKQQ